MEIAIDIEELHPLRLNTFSHKLHGINFPLVDDRFAAGNSNIMGVYANLPDFYNNYKFNAVFSKKWAQVKFDLKDRWQDFFPIT